MTTGIEARLRADMEQFTRDVHVPPGLAHRAYRRGRKRRATLRIAIASATAATLAAIAVAAAGASGAFGPGPVAPAETAAYVVQQVDRALASTNIDTMIGVSRTVYTPSERAEPLAGGGILIDPPIPWPGPPPPSLGPEWSVGSELSWLYRGTVKQSDYSPAGQPVFDLWHSLSSRSETETVVIYGDSTWWTWAQSVSPGDGPSSGLPNPWPALIQGDGAPGFFRVVGHQVVDGIDAVKITGFALTLWVDPATYLPVRIDKPGMQTDLSWLPPTPANLAMLKTSVPAGFQQVPPPQE